LSLSTAAVTYASDTGIKPRPMQRHSRYWSMIYNYPVIILTSMQNSSATRWLLLILWLLPQITNFF